MFKFYSPNDSTYQFILQAIIKEKYSQAILSDDWSDYDYVYNVYYNYKHIGGNAAYINQIINDYGRQYAKALHETQYIESNISVFDDVNHGTESVENSKLNYENINVKPKTFESMTYEQKMKAVNKEIDDLLDYIERNKQAKYRKYKEYYNGF